MKEANNQQVVDFDQDAPLGELTVRWDAAGRDWDAGALREEFDAGPAAAAHNDDASPAAPAVAPGEEATP